MKKYYIGMVGLLLSGLVYAATQTGTIIDLTAHDYRYLRLFFDGPTQGNVKITNTLSGKLYD